MELNENTIKPAYKLMEMITKGYQWYHDTPEQPFKYSEGSIWLINPDTKEWMIELKKSGKLWYYYKTPDTFSKYLNMEVSDFESFIKIWVEGALEKGAVSTLVQESGRKSRVEDALERGAVSTAAASGCSFGAMEDALERGVVSTQIAHDAFFFVLEDALENGKQWN